MIRKRCPVCQRLIPLSERPDRVYCGLNKDGVTPGQRCRWTAHTRRYVARKRLEANVDAGYKTLTLLGKIAVMSADTLRGPFRCISPNCPDAAMPATAFCQRHTQNKED